MADTLLGNLVWKITGDTKDFDKKLTSSEKTMTGFTGKSALAITAIGVGVGLALAKITSFVKESLKVSTEAQEQISKYGVVFGDLGDESEKAAKQFADAFDLAGASAKSMLSNTGNLLQGMGATTDESLKMSVQVNTLASDLASFTNNQGGAQAASDALTKALLGERESMKTLGIAILESDVLLRVAQNGQKDATGTALKLAKAEATLQLITEQSKNAIGDYARTQNSVANSQKRAAESTKELQVALGTALNPVLLISSNLWSGIATYLASTVKHQNELNDAKKAEKQNNATIAQRIILAQEELKIAEQNLRVEQNIASQNELTETIYTKKYSQQIKDLNATIGRLKALSDAESSIAKQKVDAAEKEEKYNKQRIDDLDKLTSLLNVEKTEYETIIDNIRTLEGIKTLSGQDEINRLKLISDLKAQQAQIDAEESLAYTAQQQEAYDASIRYLTEIQAQQNAIYEGVAALGEFERYTTEEQMILDDERNHKRLEALQDYFSNTASVLSAISGLSSALFNQEISQLDKQMQKELERAGLASQTAAEKAQQDLDIIKKTGTADEIAEAEKALKKAEIEEKYAKKKAKLEYDAAVVGWQLQKAMAIATGAQAILGAVAAFPYWPLNAASVGLATSIAGLQIAAVQAAKPVKKFAMGGIVPGSSTTGDKVPIMVNSQEEIIRRDDPRHTYNGGKNGGVTLQVGTLIADKAGLRELNRQLSKLGVVEKARIG